MRIPRPKLNYANVIATIALFVALGGAAVAAGLPKKSVGPQQLKPGAVRTKALHRKAVTSGKIAPQAVTAGKLGPFAVLPGNLGNGIITTEKLGDGSVVASKLKNGVVTTNKLSNGNVTTAKLADGAVINSKLADGSVTPAKLAAGTITQLRSKVESGETLRGAFELGSVAASAGDTTRTAISFQLPLTFEGVSVLPPGQTNTVCGGAGANGDAPQALPGHVCIYVTKEVNLPGQNPPLAVDILNRLGVGLVAQAKEPGTYYAYGVWAGTAR